MLRQDDGTSQVGIGIRQGKAPGAAFRDSPCGASIRAVCAVGGFGRLPAGPGCDNLGTETLRRRL